MKFNGQFLGFHQKDNFNITMQLIIKYKSSRVAGIISYFKAFLRNCAAAQLFNRNWSISKTKVKN